VPTLIEVIDSHPRVKFFRVVDSHIDDPSHWVVEPLQTELLSDTNVGYCPAAIARPHSLTRHNQRPSRKANSSSSGRNRPGGMSNGVTFASA
jgi:hypothetical protein